MSKAVLKLKRLGSKAGHDRKAFLYTQRNYKTQCNYQRITVVTEWDTSEKTYSSEVF